MPGRERLLQPYWCARLAGARSSADARQPDDPFRAHRPIVRMFTVEQFAVCRCNAYVCQRTDSVGMDMLIIGAAALIALGLER